MNKRPNCVHCLRPIKTCICKHIKLVENLAPVVVLQHPLEIKEAKNTGRLLHLCLKNSQIFEGESFSDVFYESTQPSRFCDILLYPSEPNDEITHAAPDNDVPLTNIGANNLLNSAPYRLWILDATWRKSRKMLYLNPFLQAMPRLSLHDCPVSQYTIRKAHKENQLSSLEASCYALQKLEANQVDYSPVLHAFATFVAEQLTFLPSSK